MRLKCCILVFFLFTGVFHLRSQSLATSISLHDLVFNNLRPNHYPLNHLFNDAFLQDSIHHYEFVSGEGWVNNEKMFFTYNGKGLVKESVKTIFDEDLQEWVFTYKRVFEYNEAGQVILDLVQVWDNGSINWSNNFQTLYYYDSTGNVSEKVSQVWSEEAGYWKSDNRESWIYNDNGLPTSLLIEVWIPGEHWVLENMVIYEYGGDDDLNYSLIQSWDDEMASWENDELISFFYDENNNLHTSVTNSWSPNQSSWTHEVTQEFNYSDEGKLQEVNSQVYSPSQIMVEDNIQQVSYDENGNIEVVTVKEWDELLHEWVNLSQDTYFWSLYKIESPAASSDQQLCILSNPYHSGNPIYCEELIPGEQYSLDLYDLSGRLFHSSAITGGENFTLPVSGLTKGLYLMNITGYRYSYSHKLLVNH